ncbi:MAG TPA: P-loop NTPase fold protein, partial [Gammaproteobacteria bacterium]
QQLFPDQNIQAMQRDEVAQRLERDYWQRIHGDQIQSPAVAENILSAVLNLDLTTAVRLAQRVLGTMADGVMGPQTLRAINGTGAEDFISRYRTEVANFINTYKTTPMEGAAPSKEAEFNIAEKGRENLNESPFTQAQSTAQQTVLHQFGNTTFSEEPAEFNNAAKARENRNESPFTQAQSTTQQTVLDQDGNTAINEEPAETTDRFNVDAIAKKSTSDIWTIKDQLGYETYAQAIAKLIIDNKAEPPLTVSIQAPWGQGKTSLMRMIKHKLEQGLKSAAEKPQAATTQQHNDIPGTQAKLNNLDAWIKEEKAVAQEPAAMLTVKPGAIPCVWFNPLYFQDSKQIWSGLAHAILHQLAGQLETRLEKERFWFRLRLTRLNTRAIRRDIHQLILERLLPKGLMWFGVLLGMLATQFFTSTPVAEFLRTHTWLNALPVIGGLGHGLLNWLIKNKDWALDDKLVKYINEPVYEGDLGLLHLVEHDLDRALELLLGKDGRLCVFIDDLDRCTPDTVNSILLAINQFISVQHRKLYFILGMDTHMVAMAIETAAEKQAATYNKNRHTSKGYGWRFMEKFVQLPFFIPRISPEEAQKFLGNLLKGEQLAEVASADVNALKKQIDLTTNLPELQELVVNFKNEHNIDFIPEVDATVASRMIDLTSEEDSDTLNNLVVAAMSDLELNPREMKRFLNVARLLFIRINHQDDVSSQEHMLKIVRASHLILNWPQCLRWLQGNARSYTLKGEKTDPVKCIEALYDNPDIEDYEDWCNAIKETWGETVADTVAQPDFYTFSKRIHDSPPGLSQIFTARIF